jgi:hypothetical protein
MALFCSTEIFEALDGIKLPATKEDILEYAQFKDAREAVIVVLNNLDDRMIFHDVSEVCENARTACNLQVIQALSGVSFPARREDLVRWADRANAPSTVIYALEALPSEYTYRTLDEVCEYIL